MIRQKFTLLWVHTLLTVKIKSNKKNSWRKIYFKEKKLMNGSINPITLRSSSSRSIKASWVVAKKTLFLSWLLSLTSNRNSNRWDVKETWMILEKEKEKRDSWRKRVWVIWRKQRMTRTCGCFKHLRNRREWGRK